MSTAPIPTGMDDVTAEWLTAAVGPSFGGATVTAVEKQQIGTGQIADSVRLALTWDPPDAGPASLVAKVTSASEASRQAAISTRTYEVEVGFYSELAERLPVRRPACYWTGFDLAAASYGVVLEDLAPAEQGDQMRGCSVDEAALAIDELALLHGPLWGHPEALDGYTWLNRGSGTTSPGIGSFLEMLLPGFLERYADRLTPEVLELIERVVPKLKDAPPADGPETVVHGDYRNDNLMFGGERVCVLDWQTVSVGHGVADVSYFLGGSLLPEDRRAHERELLERYCALLAAQDVALDLDVCLAEYRRFAFSGMNMAILASMLVGRTDRGDEMFIAMADRAGLHALDHDTEGLLALMPKLTAMDELFVHQIPEALPAVYNHHEHWRESLFFIVHPRDRLGDVIILTMATFPAKGELDVLQLGRIGDAMTMGRHSRPYGDDPHTMEVGPVKIDIVEPFKTVKLDVVPDPAAPVSLDLTFTARTPAHGLRRGTMKAGHEIIWDQSHMIQSGNFNGTVTHQGTTYEIDDWWGQRDHSWGIRNHARCPFWMWLAIQLPDGMLAVWCWELPNGARIYTDGCWSPADGGAPVPVIRFDHDLHWTGAGGNEVSYDRDGAEVTGIAGHVDFTLEGGQRIGLDAEGRWAQRYGPVGGGLSEVVVTTDDGRTGTAIYELTGAHHHRYFPVARAQNLPS